MAAVAADYYELLGIARTATKDEVIAAYRRLARELHPDRHQGDRARERLFARVNEAYMTLKDPRRRAWYDRWNTSLFERKEVRLFAQACAVAFTLGFVVLAARRALRK